MEASSPTTPPETYDDQKPLLENSSDAVNPSIQNDNLDEPADVDVDPRVVERSRPKHVKVTIERFAFVLLNLIGILISCSGRLHSPLVDQYLYKVFAGPLAGNQSQHTASNPCFSDNSTLNTSQKEQQVQAMTSQMLLELDLTKYGLGIIANLVMGALSAVVSRRVVMLVPLFGYLIRCVIIFLVVFLALDVNWLFAGYAVDGIMGSVNGIYFATYLYTSEITSRDKSRTLALAILESVKGAVTAAVYVVTGQLIQHTGYNWPAILSAACTLLAVVLAFALPPRPPRPSPTAVTKSSPLLPTPVEGYWDKMKTPFKQGRQKGLTALVTLACLAFFLDRISDFMVAKVRTLYVMNQPFCWSSSQIGWFDSGTQMACYLFTMVSVCLFARYLSGGVSVAIPAVLSAAGGHCVYAFATDDIELYAAPVLGMSSSLSSCLLRGETSRALGPQAQGPWFAVIAVIESLSFTLGTPALAVYRASLGFFRGLVFLIAAGLLLCEIFLLLAFQLKWRKFISRKGQTIVVPSATEDPDPKE